MPEVIEIHPPFIDYCQDLEKFIGIYRLFESVIKEKYPSTKIHLENRSGSIYSKGQFLITNCYDLIDLCEKIKKENLNLEIALDIPQLYTAHHVEPQDPKGKNKSEVTKILRELHMIREHIGGVHLWGKKLSQNGRSCAHAGDFNTYFSFNMIQKNEFLYALKDLFSDRKIRNLVLEVNSSNEDMLSIIRDLELAEFEYFD